ncbi:dephospho-CoA kinase [Streptomyces sp. NBC_01497]|uniref:dephospho-CoA kinase n=1 Tax=Streptomyces sp. NBC_01497 TaxID=2903885 RepID=UPI002E370BAE|nr:dephospho-CoA kinase [Streptomyces sp. NBC_01497]
MLRVGLTGGIGSGKSEVAKLLVSYGAVLVDADRIAREVVEPGTPGLAAVVAEFGDGILTEEGTLDRPRLGAVVFADEERRRALNAIVHPLVRERSAELERSAGDDAIVVQDVPLLVEGGMMSHFDVVLVVDASPGTQLDRLVRLRGMTADDARRRMTAQATREQRRAAADVVIDNDGPREALEPRVRSVWGELERRAASPGEHAG